MKKIAWAVALMIIVVVTSLGVSILTPREYRRTSPADSAMVSDAILEAPVRTVCGRAKTEWFKERETNMDIALTQVKSKMGDSIGLVGSLPDTLYLVTTRGDKLISLKVVPTCESVPRRHPSTRLVYADSAV